MYFSALYAGIIIDIILISIPPPSVGGTNSNESVFTFYVILQNSLQKAILQAIFIKPLCLQLLLKKQKAKAIKQAKKLLQHKELLPPDEPLAS